MGAWGPGNFQNDAALDWLADLLELATGVDVFVRQTLKEAATAKAGQALGTNVCCAALAAGEVVAISLGHPPPYVPENLARWVENGPVRFDRSDIELASAAAIAIEEGSELQDLFDEMGRYEAWHEVVKDLLARLSAAAPSAP